jgi:hypothetical protein
MQRKGWVVAAVAMPLIFDAIGIDWLAKPEEVFPRRHDGYLWTAVHLSGTTDAAQQDLRPRIMEVLKGSRCETFKLTPRDPSTSLG